MTDVPEEFSNAVIKHINNVKDTSFKDKYGVVEQYEANLDDGSKIVVKLENGKILCYHKKKTLVKVINPNYFTVIKTLHDHQKQIILNRLQAMGI